MRLTSSYSRVAMPANKPCPHCGRPVEDWHREWYTVEQQKILHNRLAAADCPHVGCEGGVDLYSVKDDVPAADPKLDVIQRSRGKAVTWAGSETDPENYLQNVTSGKQYENYPFSK